MAPRDTEDRDWQRLDKWLWCARFMRARADCAAAAEAGLLRINRQPTEKPHARLRVGDVLTMRLHGEVRVVEVTALAMRRGPAPEARTLYREISPPEPPGVRAVPCGTGETAAYRRDDSP